MTASRLPATSGRRVIRALERAGFMIDRVVGSHHVMTFPGDPSRTATVPVHGGREARHPAISRSPSGLTVEEFVDFL